MKELSNYGFEVSKAGKAWKITKPSFELKIDQQFLQQMDYVELRRIELVIRDLMKEGRDYRLTEEKNG